MVTKLSKMVPFILFSVLNMIMSSFGPIGGNATELSLALKSFPLGDEDWP